MSPRGPEPRTGSLEVRTDRAGEGVDVLRGGPHQAARLCQLRGFSEVRALPLLVRTNPAPTPVIVGRNLSRTDTFVPYGAGELLIGGPVGGLAGFALRKWERKLRSSMTDRESLLDFDSGRDDAGKPVTCFASTNALYTLYRGGTVLRLPYDNLGVLRRPVASGCCHDGRAPVRLRVQPPATRLRRNAPESTATAVIRERADRWRAEGRLLRGEHRGGQGSLALSWPRTARSRRTRPASGPMT